MRIWRTVRLPIGITAAAAIVVVALWPQPVAVDLAAVTSGPMTVTVDEDGETRVRDRFVISAPVSGRLQRIELEPGDTVAKGVVVRLAPVDAPLLDSRTRAELQAAAAAAREAVGQARADRDRAIASLERAKASAARLSHLAEIGAVSREDHDTAQTTARTAAAASNAANFAVARAEQEQQLAAARLLRPGSHGRLVDVISPVEGVVLKRLRESECVVNAGDPLLEIGDPKQLELVVDLLSVDAVRVRPGDRVSIERWGGSQALSGRVRRVEPSGFLKVSALGVEEQRVNVVIDFDDPDRAARKLGDGYRAEARIVVWENDVVVMVPLGSLFRHGVEWAVFIADGDRARMRKITLGERNNEAAQVVDGLKPGEQVVLYPPDTLADGARIRARVTAAVER
jgi:HlyD family secretion protein